MRKHEPVARTPKGTFDVAKAYFELQKLRREVALEEAALAHVPAALIAEKENAERFVRPRSRR
jgi:hypothetical protein